jgi:L-lactate dehydrogenase complex protein LldG
MTAARDAILERLRLSGAATRLPRTPGAEIPPAAPRSLDECLTRFCEEAAALDVTCFVEPTADTVRTRVAGLIAAQRIFSWDPAELPYDVADVLGTPVLGSSPRDAQAAADVGVTGCDGAIAETGSLVMISRPGRSRLASLLPAAHVAIVRRDQLVYSMGEFFATHAAALRDRASCTFITGPSRTADIELTLTMGIHGPGRVMVVIGP